MVSAQRHSFQRPRSKSPQSAIANVNDLLLATDSNQEKARSTTASFLRKLSLRTLLCVTLTSVLVLCSLLQAWLHVFYTDDASSGGFRGQLHRADDNCPIRQWNYPNCKPYLISRKNPSDLTTFSSEKWYQIRQTFQEIAGADVSSLDAAWQTADPAAQPHGFRVAVEVRSSPGKGRGVFLAENVTRDQTVWDNRFTARFPSECSVRQFFDSIGEQDSCNALTWGYVNDHYGLGLQFQLDLDEGVYINEASRKEDANLVGYRSDIVDANEDGYPTTTRDPNGAFYKHRRKPGNFQLRAKYDMPAGTEILMHYTDIHVYASLRWYDRLCIKTRGILGWILMQ